MWAVRKWKRWKKRRDAETAPSENLFLNRMEAARPLQAIWEAEEKQKAARDTALYRDMWH